MEGERRPILEIRPIDGIHVGRAQPPILGGTVAQRTPPKDAPIRRPSPDPYPTVHRYVPAHSFHPYQDQLPFTGKVYFPVGLPYAPPDRFADVPLREDWRRPEPIVQRVVEP